MDTPIIGAEGKEYPKGTILDQYGHPIGWPYRSGQMYMINGDQIVVKSQLVEIVINPSGSAANVASSWNLPDQPNLRNAAIWGLEVFDASILPTSPLSGNALIPATDMGYLFLTMQDYASFNFLQLHPCRSLQQQYNSATTSFGRVNPPGFIGQHVNWPLTEIFITNTTPFQSNSYSFLMKVQYSYKDNWQRDGLGKSFGSRS